MSDPEARVVVTASDRTAAALASADRGIKRLGSSVRNLRSIAAGFGVVLSARAFAGWIAGAMDAKKMTDEQIEATREARAAMAQMKAASDELARSLATSLAPAMTTVAKIATGLNAIIFNADPSPLGQQIEDLKDQLKTVDRGFNPDTPGMLFRNAEQQVAEQKRLLAEIERLKQRQLEILTGGNRFDQLEEFDIGAIREQRAEVMRSMPDFDVNAPSEAMKRRAEQITASMRTELEEQIATMREADALLARGLISPETLQRMQDSLLQPIKVTAEMMKDTNAERLKNLMETFKSEEQLELDRYAQRLEDLQDLYDAEIVQREEFFTLKEELELEHQDRMTEIETAAADERFRKTKMHQQNTVDTIVGGLTDATAALANGSKRMFELNKKFAKAEAIVNAHRAIQQVWADPALPFYAKVAATAVTAVRTAANIAAINATTFGGGTTPSAAGGATVNNVPVGSNQIITVRGINPTDLFTGRQIVELVNQATKNGAKLVLAN